MKVKELINIINNSENCYSISDAEDLMGEEVEIVASWLKPSSHRWYIIATNVYKCEDGFIGIRGLVDIKTEYMDAVDCGIESNAFEVKQIPGLIFNV